MVDGGRTVFQAAEFASMQEVHVVTAEDVFVGVDMGKDAHYAQAITAGGVEVFDRPVPNDETEIRTLIENATEYGVPVLVIDQPSSMAQLLLAVARSGVGD